MRAKLHMCVLLLSAVVMGLAQGGQTVQSCHYIGTQFDSGTSCVTTRSGLRDTTYVANIGAGTNIIWTARQPDGAKLTKWGYCGNVSRQLYGNFTWSDSSELTYVWTSTGNGTANVAARFDYITYGLVYDSNGGGSLPSLTGLLYTNQFALAAAPEPSPAGYRFTHWTASSTNSTFAAGATVSGKELGLGSWHADNGTVTMTANWAPNGYGIVCEPNGGVWTSSFSPPSSAVYDTVFSLPPLARKGYDFLGWKVTDNLDTATARWGTTGNPTSVMDSDKAYANGAGLVYFKNLNPANGITVTLTAQWRGSTIHVSFNNRGATSGKESTDVTFDAAYGAVNVPYKEGNTFLGYRINGETYWDKEGQPVKSLWDIPKDCTAEAVWETKVYTITYHENLESGVSHQEIQSAAHGVSVELFRGDGFSNYGCTLLGWSVNSKATAADIGFELREGEVPEHAFTESTMLYAVWEKCYYVAYDGNGATNDELQVVQKFVFNKGGQTLLPNCYLKPGYSLKGWATNRTAAAELVVEYKDCQMISKDLATRLGETNTLYAAWNTNTYSIAYDANGGTGTIATNKCLYDHPVTLSDGKEFSNGAYNLVGWSNDVTKAVYGLGEQVRNLCDEADGTTTLYAVWKLSELSAAMKCDNLRWESYDHDSPILATNAWTAVAGSGVGQESDSCVRQTGSSVDEQQWLTAQVSATGSVSFVWRPTGADKTLAVWWSTVKIATQPDSPGSDNVGTNFTGVAGVWKECRLEGIPKDWHLKLCFKSDVGYVDIDRMTWVPDGYTMKFDTDGGAETIPDERVAFGTDGTFPSAVPTREANVFRGWKREKDATLYQPGAVFHDKDLTNNNEVVTFVAQWQAATATEVPVAVTGLVYDGTEKTGVPAGIGYTLIGQTATNAGSYVATATLTDGYVWAGGSPFPADLLWTIAQATQDVSGVTFEDAVFTYDGKSHSIAVGGAVPSGVTVVYDGATNRTSVGTNVVTASFSVVDAVNYAAITNVLQARLIVLSAPDPLTTNAVPAAVVGLVYDGTAKTGVPMGEGYVIVGNVGTNAGTYVATATLEEGYAWTGGSTAPTNITWSIAKATYDMSGVSFTNATFVADGQPHSLTVSGVLPKGVSVSYSGNGMVDAGSYAVTAMFAGDAVNYGSIEAKTATMTIVAAPGPTPPGPEPTEDVFVGNVTYIGWLENAAGELAGTVTLKAAKEKKGTSQVSGTIQTLVGKKVTLAKRSVPTGQETPPKDADGLFYYGSCVCGTVSVAGEACSLMAYADQFKSADKATKDAAKKEVPSGTWTFAFEDADGICHGLSVTIAAKTAKTKVTGVLPGGLKLSVSATGVYNADRSVLYVPVVYSKKGASLGFVLAVSPDRIMTLHSLAVDGFDVRGIVAEPMPLTAVQAGDYAFETSLSGTDYAAVSDDGFALAPTGVRFSLTGTKLTGVEKTVGSVKAVDGKIVVKYREGSQTPANLAKLKLKYAAKTGVVTGSFVLYRLDAGKLRSATATVNGVLSGAQILGNASVKKTGEVLPVGMIPAD